MPALIAIAIGIILLIGITDTFSGNIGTILTNPKYFSYLIAGGWGVVVWFYMGLTKVDNWKGQIPTFFRYYFAPVNWILRKIISFIRLDHRVFWKTQFPHLAKKNGYTLVLIVFVLGAFWISWKVYDWIFFFISPSVAFAAASDPALTVEHSIAPFWKMLGTALVILFVIIPFLIFISKLSIFSTMKSPKHKDETRIITYKELPSEQRKTKGLDSYFIPKTILNRNKFSKTNNTLIFSRHIKLNPKKVFEHSVVVAATGSGKSASVLIPQILELNGTSFIATDPKAELHQKTKENLKKKGYKVYHIDLRKNAEKGNFLMSPTKFNPLQHCKTADDVRKLAQIVLENGQTGDKNTEWIGLSKSLYEVFLFIAWKNGKSLSYVNELMNDSRVNISDFTEFETFIESHDCEEANLAFQNFKKAGGSEKTVSSMFVTIQAATQVFNYENVNDLQKGHIDIYNFRKEKSALFISYPPMESEIFAPLLATMYYQIMNAVASVNEDNDMSNVLPVYFLLDEFANIGKIPGFNNFLTTVRSQKIGVEIFLQSKDQLETLYGAKETNVILENCKTKVAMGGLTGESAKFFSELAGNQTGYSHSESYDGKPSRSEKDVAVLTSDRIRRLRSNQVLIVADNLNPIIDDKNYYFQYDMEYWILKKMPFSPELNKKILDKIPDAIKKINF